MMYRMIHMCIILWKEVHTRRSMRKTCFCLVSHWKMIAKAWIHCIDSLTNIFWISFSTVLYCFFIPQFQEFTKEKLTLDYLMMTIINPIELLLLYSCSFKYVLYVLKKSYEYTLLLTSLWSVIICRFVIIQAIFIIFNFPEIYSQPSTFVNCSKNSSLTILSLILNIVPFLKFKNTISSVILFPFCIIPFLDSSLATFWASNIFFLLMDKACDFYICRIQMKSVVVNYLFIFQWENSTS